MACGGLIHATRDDVLVLAISEIYELLVDALRLSEPFEKVFETICLEGPCIEFQLERRASGEALIFLPVKKLAETRNMG